MSDPTKAPPSARRAALGFTGGGQVLSLRLQDDALEALRKALQDAKDGWYEVADVGAALAELSEAGAELIDEVPRAGLFGLEVAFVHPDAVHGVLTEVVSVE